ncbi:MAG: glycosyltransferase family protein [Patescibacteria group bacterium]
MNTIAMIQARTGSTRLPKKVLLKLGGKTVLEQVIERVQRSRSIDEAMVVTTLSINDLAIVKLCAELGIRVFCGSEADVLDRFYQAAKILKPQNIVRVTADCPLIDPDIIDLVVLEHKKNKNDYTSNVLEETFPDGQDNEVITMAALEQAWNGSNLLSEREHVTLYIRNNPDIFKLGSVRSKVDYSRKRWTLDTRADYNFLVEIYNKLHSGNHVFGMRDILDLLEKNPELEKININIDRNEGLKKSLLVDKIMDK